MAVSARSVRQVQKRVVDAADGKAVGIAAGHAGCFPENRFHVLTVGHDAPVDRHDELAGVVGEDLRVVQRSMNILLLLPFLGGQGINARGS